MAYETNPLLALWYALPPNVRQQYTSGLKAAGELSPGAAVRDVVDESGKMVDAAKGGNWVDAASGPAKMAVAALGVIPGTKAATKTIRAYHGSPHSFDKFDLNKIGTGEGAQAYGHGLYFAENEGVARGYRDQLSSPMFKTPDGTLFDPQSQLQHVNIRVAAHRNGSDLDATIARAEQLLPKASEQTRPMIEHDIAVLRSFKDQGGIKPNPGHMYEVGIHTDPAKMLDWDKPLSQQSPEVQKAVAQFGIKGDPFGANIYESSKLVPGDYRDPAAASAALKEGGVPGIKYLDQGSRGWTVHNTYKGEPYGNPLKFPTQQQAAAYAAEQEAKGFGTRVAQEGTSNYAVFDPTIIEILRKYGMLPATVAAGATGAATVPGLLAPNDKGTY